MSPKYALHELVAVRGRPGRTGKVLMIEVDATLNGVNHKYLLNCFPGALGYFVTVILPGGYGDPPTFHANWFEESRLKPLKAKAPISA